MTIDQPILVNLETTELKRNFNIPIVLILVAVLLTLIKLWLGVVVGLFGFFLLVQTFTLTLKFTSSSLEIYRGEKIIRDFPYSQWQYSEIFWSKLPILFYFREDKSIHFLPIIFDSKMLNTCLERYPCHFKSYTNINNP
jgi:hypothetical protein